MRKYFRTFATVIAALAALAALGPAARAASLELRSTRLSARQGAALFAPALRAPADSAALRASLAGLVARLEDDGLLDAHATAAWNGDRLVVDVREGAAYRWRRIDVRAFAAAESAEIAAGLALVPGEPASPSRLTAAMDRALARATEHGHPYARLTVSGWDADSGGVAVAIGGSLGPDVTFGGVRFDGAHVTNARLLARAAGPLAGPWKESAAEAARTRVEQLGLFRSVTLGAPEPGADFHRARVVMRVEERPYNEFEGVLGAQGGGGLVGLARVQLDNLAGTGRAATVRWESRGHGVSEALARYREPLVLGLPLALEFTLEQQTYDTLYTRSRGGFGAGWALSATEHVEAGAEIERVSQQAGDVHEASTQTTRVAWRHERLDDALTPRRGDRVSLEASQSFSRRAALDGAARSLRSSAAEAVFALHRPLGRGTGLALEVRAAGRIGSDHVLPIYDRFALGGAASLRGYDEEAFRVDRYALSRFEWRAFLGGGQYAFLFWDHAAMATRLAAGTADRLQVLQKDGYGAGLSLTASAGRVAVTYGVASGSGPLAGKLHLQVLTPF